MDTSGGREGECIAFLGRLLGQAGVEPTYLALEAGRPNLVARVAGRGEAPPLLLYGHVDVVPAAEASWSRPPFSAELVDSVVWGRGALDMKGGVAMLLTAFLETAAGTPPPGDVVLVLTVDEESGGRAGMGFLVERHPELFAGVRHALGESGGFTQWHGSRRLVPIQVAEKQRCFLRATVTGRSGHAASVVDDSAAAKLGQFLSRVTTRRLPVHLTPPTRLMFDAIAAALPLTERVGIRLLQQPVLAGPLLGGLRAGGRRLAPFFCSTVTPTSVRSGSGGGVHPSEAVVELDGRVLPGVGLDRFVREVEALARGLARIELISAEPAIDGPVDLGLLDLLSSVLREREPDCAPFPMLSPGYTDARFLSRLGIQTYGFLPMRLPREIRIELIHGVDERIPASEVAFGTACIRDVISRYR